MSSRSDEFTVMVISVELILLTNPPVRLNEALSDVLLVETLSVNC